MPKLPPRPKRAIQKPQPFPFQIGELVEFIAKNNEEGYTELTITEGHITRTIKSGQTKMTPPTMAVNEVVLENSSKAHLFDEITGNAKRSGFKVHCVWFSTKTCKFFDRWFNSGMLRKSSHPEEEQIPAVKGELNEVVTLKTYLSAYQSEEFLFSAKWTNLDNSVKNWKLTQSFNHLSFLPPKMVITEVINDPDKQKPLFDKNNGTKIREVSEEYAKCMWYDPNTGKFSEHVFPLDCLIPENSLPDTKKYLLTFLDS